MNEHEKIRVVLDKTIVGYTLAEDVLKEKEIKLIRKGIVLTEKLCESLKKHNVKYVYVYRLKNLYVR